LFLKTRKRKNRNNRKAVSVAAASDKMCFTSDGKGLSTDKLTAWGVLIMKLEKVGSNFFMGTEEFPNKATNSFCFVTTACGKFKLSLMYRAVKKKITKHI